MRRYCFLLFALVLAACSSAAPATQLPQGAPANIAPSSRLLGDADSAVAEPGKPAPDFQYTMADGTTVRLSDLRGKKVLINFWATWCEPCRSEMPDLEHAAASNRADLVVIGVNKGEQADLFPEFLRQIPVSFALVADPNGGIARAYGVVSGIPQSFFLNRDGTLASRRIAPMSTSLISEELGRLK
jgi:peroxiredoxin